MKKLTFKSGEEFQQAFRSKDVDITDSIVASIEEAMANGHKTAKLFEITFEEHDYLYEISLPQSQWVSALQSCLDLYHELGLADPAIDTWKLLEAAKVW